VLIEDELYKRGGSLAYSCGASLETRAASCYERYMPTPGPRTLVGKAFRYGIYWPTAVADSKDDIVRRCEGCEFYARQTHLLAQALQTIPITWPFAV
jgi:hypothetical protein